MTEKNLNLKVIKENTPASNSHEAPIFQEPKRVDQKLIKIQGTLTSQIQLRDEKTREPYYYAFVKLKEQKIDLPVIFKIKDDQEAKLAGHYDPTKKQCYSCLAELSSQESIWCSPCKERILSKDKGLIKPTLKKSDQVELTGYYSISEKSVRKSFTVTSYQILNHKRIRKKCVGCCDNFTCYQSQNYDYCRNCEINGSRYVVRENKCPECGDGSGLIKFPNQPPRSCKLCYLAKQEQIKENIFAKHE